MIALTGKDYHVNACHICLKKSAFNFIDYYYYFIIDYFVILLFFCLFYLRSLQLFYSTKRYSNWTEHTLFTAQEMLAQPEPWLSELSELSGTVRLCESSDSPTARDFITTLTYYVVCALGNRVMAQDPWFPHTHVLLVRFCLPVLLYATAIATAGQPSQSCRTQILSPISSPGSQWQPSLSLHAIPR